MGPFSGWPSLFEQAIFNSDKHGYVIRKPTRLGAAGIHAISVALHDGMRNEGLQDSLKIAFPTGSISYWCHFPAQNMFSPGTASPQLNEECW